MTDVLAPTLPSTFNPETGAGESVGELRQPSSSGNPAQPRSGHLNLDTFSPVNQNGSFAFDRVLKSGEINKRTRKTKQWKAFYLVLRPNLLSLYKDSSESRLLKQISLSDLTAVAYLKDPKGRRENVFGVFSPSRNFHLQAKTQADAHEWVEGIRREARIDAEENDMILQSPTTAGHDRWKDQSERLGSSSPEPSDLPAKNLTTRDGVRIPGIGRPSGASLDYSGDETGPYTSDFSDTIQTASADPISSSFGSFIPRKQRQQPLQSPKQFQSGPNASQRPESTTLRNASYSSLPHDPAPESSERTIWHGYLLALRTKRAGVRQWKRLWVVLRPKNIAFYKSNQEYAATLILPLSTCIDAVEIDPISRSKKYCMQLITEEKGYRFCAESEDDLAQWLGAIKMQLNRRKDGRD